MERTASKQYDGLGAATQSVMGSIPLPTGETLKLWSRGRAHTVAVEVVEQGCNNSTNVPTIPVNEGLSVSSHVVEGATPHHEIDEGFGHGVTYVRVRSRGRSHSVRLWIEAAA